MSAVQDSLRPAAYLAPIEPPPSTPVNAPSVPLPPSHRRAHSLAGTALDGFNADIPLEQRNVSILTIVEEPSEGLELAETATHAATASVDTLLERMQAAEKLLDQGHAALKTLLELGAKGVVVTALESAVKEIGDVVDRARELKQAVANGAILDVATATARLETDLREAADALHQVVEAGKEKIAELQSCCSRLLSFFGKKA